MRSACGRCTSASIPAPPNSRPIPPTCTRPTRKSAKREPTDRKKIMVLGGGPNRIGQGIEFDYCCVHAALALREDGFETIMVNCNPETVSTDYDTSDRLYFEPLTLEDVLEIVHVEKPYGVIVQYGGQTPLKLARDLEANGVPIIGTTPDSIDVAEDRERFQKLLHKLKLKQPPNRTARSAQKALAAGRGDRLSAGGAAVLRARRPRHGNRLRAERSRALHARGGQGLATTRRCCSTASSTMRSKSTSMRSATARQVLIGGIMEHIEQAGVHSGDSACSLPPFSLSPEMQDELRAPDRRDGAGAERGRPDERAVRDPGRHGDLRARSQSARLAHRAVRVQGDRPAAGQDRGALHGRQDAGRAGRLEAKWCRRITRSRRRCSRSSNSPASTPYSGRR